MTATCWLSTLSTLGMTIAVSGCLAATPFDTEPSEEGITARNLARIRALPPAPEPFKFVALGDTHDNYSALGRAVDAINARDDVQFVIVAGDLTDLSLLGEFEFTREEFARLEVPYLTVIGNHDALGDGIEIYQRMFGPLDYTLQFGFGEVRLLQLQHAGVRRKGSQSSLAGRRALRPRGSRVGDLGDASGG